MNKQQDLVDHSLRQRAMKKKCKCNKKVHLSQRHARDKKPSPRRITHRVVEKILNEWKERQSDIELITVQINAHTNRVRQN